VRETLFDITFYLAAPFWALMIFAPGWSWTKRILASPLIVVPPLVLYVVLIAPIFGDFAAAMLSPSLSGVHDVVSTIDGTAALWAHLIAFDLFVGRWMYFDSRASGVNAFLMAPVLVLTILLSPFGLMTYLVIRAVCSKVGDRAPLPVS
jgi:hypothetical protein